WKGPLREDDREQQTQVVEGFISQGISGIVLAPFDSRALVRPVEEAARAGIPTVVVDSALDTDKIVSFIATDNEKGGALAAVRTLGRRSLVGVASSATFVEAMEEGKLQGIVVQDPFRMGELGVKAIVDHLDGKPVAGRVDTGATMVTPTNRNEPGIQRL